MTGDWVLVHPHDNVEPFRFWLGWEEEQRVLKATKPREGRKRKPAGQPADGPSRRVRTKSGPGTSARDAAGSGADASGAHEEDEYAEYVPDFALDGVSQAQEEPGEPDEEVLLFGEDPDLLDAGIEADYVAEILHSMDADSRGIAVEGDSGAVETDGGEPSAAALAPDAEASGREGACSWRACCRESCAWRRRTRGTCSESKSAGSRRR